MHIHERLMAAMRALDALEREVRKCQTAMRARYDAEHEVSKVATGASRQEDVASANLQVVLERRKELGRFWALDLEDIKEDVEKAEIERLLKPLRLRDMTDWSKNEQHDNYVEASSGQRVTSRQRPFNSLGQEKLAERGNRVRPRKSSGLQYTPGHIFRIFDPQEAAARVTRRKIAIEAEDEDDESDEGEDSEGSASKPLSVASTGSNITVYRPPTPTRDEDARAITKAAPGKRKKPPMRDPGKRDNLSRRKQKFSSALSISSRDTVDIDPLDEIAINSGSLWEDPIFTPVTSQRKGSIGSAWNPSETLSVVKRTAEMAGGGKANWDRGIATSSNDDQRQSVTNTSDLSFATSNGTGLFVSDKKRPKRTSMTVVEGTILGGSDSHIYFPMPSPVSQEKPHTVSGRSTKTSGRSTKNKTNKRKNAPSIDAPRPETDKARPLKRGKCTIEVGDLVTASLRRKRPPRTTVKNRFEFLVGTASNDDDAKSEPLSWQAKGRGKGVTRAIPLGELGGSKSSLDDKK